MPVLYYHMKQMIHLLQIFTVCFEAKNSTLLEAFCGGEAVIIVDALKFTVLTSLGAGA